MAIDGIVYDVSRFVPFHPGGTRVLEMYAGRDATAPFQRSHMSSAVLECVASCRVGRLVASSASPPPSSSGAATTGDGVPPDGVQQEATPSPLPLLQSAGGEAATGTSGLIRGATTSSLSSAIIESTASSRAARSATDAIPTPQSPPPPSQSQPIESSLAATLLDDEVRPWADMTLQQLTTIASKSRLFSSVTPDVLAGAVSEAAARCAEGDVEEEEALRELFVTLDTDGKGYIKRTVLRDFFYRLDSTGVSEEALLRAPEQITAVDFLRLFRQL